MARKRRVGRPRKKTAKKRGRKRNHRVVKVKGYHRRVPYHYRK